MPSIECEGIRHSIYLVLCSYPKKEIIVRNGICFRYCKWFNRQKRIKHTFSYCHSAIWNNERTLCIDVCINGDNFILIKSCLIWLNPPVKGYFSLCIYKIHIRIHECHIRILCKYFIFSRERWRYKTIITFEKGNIFTLFWDFRKQKIRIFNNSLIWTVLPCMNLIWIFLDIFLNYPPRCIIGRIISYQ